jgi:hypothetical protein
MLIRHQVWKRNIEEKTKAKFVIIERGKKENLREWEGVMSTGGGRMQ